MSVIYIKIVSGENFEKIQVELLKDHSEAVPYENRKLPLYIRIRNLSDYINMRSFAHWHDEVEMMYIVDGKLNYHVKGKNIPLDTHDCAITNCGHMHFSSSAEFQECTFFV